MAGVVDAILWALSAAAIGFIAMGCVVTSRPRKSLSRREDNPDAKLDRTG